MNTLKNTFNQLGKFFNPPQWGTLRIAFFFLAFLIAVAGQIQISNNLMSPDLQLRDQAMFFALGGIALLMLAMGTLQLPTDPADPDTLADTPTPIVDKVRVRWFWLVVSI